MIEKPFNLLEQHIRRAVDVLKSLPDEAEYAFNYGLTWEPSFDYKNLDGIYSIPHYCPKTERWRKTAFVKDYLVRDGRLMCGISEISVNGRKKSLQYMEVFDVAFEQWEESVDAEFFSDHEVNEYWQNYFRWCSTHGQDPLKIITINNIRSENWEAYIKESPIQLDVMGLRRVGADAWLIVPESPVQVKRYLCLEEDDTGAASIRKDAVPHGFDQLIELSGFSVIEQNGERGSRKAIISFSVDIECKEKEDTAIKEAAQALLEAA